MKRMCHMAELKKSVTMRLCQSVPTLEPIGYREWHSIVRKQGLTYLSAFNVQSLLYLFKEHGLYYDEDGYYITQEAKERYGT